MYTNKKKYRITNYERQSLIINFLVNLIEVKFMPFSVLYAS